MSGNSERPGKMSRQKLDLLIRRLGDKKKATRQQVEGIPSIPRESFPCRFPLSFSQQRLWLLDQLHPGSAAYNIAGAIDLRGALDAVAMERAVEDLLARHEVLRTSFELVASSNGEQTEHRDTVPQPMQVIQASVPSPWTEVDLSGLDEDERRRRADGLATEEAKRPFDLRTAPLLRTTLLRLADDHHRLIVVLHHVAADGWSLGVLLHELRSLYERARQADAEAPSPLPPLDVQYADFSQWQRQRLQGELVDNELRYWRERLAETQVLELPTDRPRPAQARFKGERLAVELAPPLAEALRRLARDHNTTLFTVLETAYAILLGRLTGQFDVTVGMPVAGRRRHEVEGLIGCFVNTLVLRHDLTAGTSFVELLKATRDMVLAADAHQELPFERLVEELSPERQLATTPFFQAVMAFEAAAVSDVTGDGLTWRPQEVGTGTSKFDLTFNLGDHGGADGRGPIRGSVEYDLDLFDGATIQRWWRHYQTLLEGVLKRPTMPWMDLPLLDAAQKLQLTVDWNGQAVAVELPEPTLHGLVSQQAQQAPERVAIVDGDGGDSLTYGELEAKANRLAHHLKSLGAGPEDLVAVCMERSVDLVVALLAVLKSGAAYLPLDLAYPTERLAFMLEDSGARWLLSGSELLPKLPPFGGSVLCLDDSEVQAAVAARPDTAPSTDRRGDDLAYVIYTSGSTGRPKGVLITHRHVARLLAACEDWFNFGGEDCWTFFHSHAFDFSVWEIWGALATGGRLVVVPYWVSRSPEAFFDLLRDQQVTVLNQTPSAFRQLVEVARHRPPSDLSLREVIFGGEALDLTTLQPWFERFGDQAPRLVNMYGITETTVHVTYRPLTAMDAQQAGRSPVGRAIPDLTLHIVDPRGQVQPVGVAGELWVGGAGVARGYLGRPGLTAERFVPDPFSDRPGARIYRSGDLARYLADGDIDFLGRIDHQVKIRGFRIELGEIEACLQGLPMVSEAAVLVQEIKGEPQLVGYWVAAKSSGDVADEAPMTVGQFRRALGERLPDYMIPAFYVALESLPLTANGKLNRRALPLPEVEASAAEYVAPRSPTERALCDIWELILGVERVGIEDDFFALGGHSLLATQIVARIRQVVGRDIPLRHLFESPTVRGLAEVLESMDEGFALPWSEMTARDDDGPAPLSFAQERLWFLEQLEPGSATYNISVRLSLRGGLEVDAFGQALSQVVARHGALRTVFRQIDEVARQVVREPAALPLPVHDLSQLKASEQAVEAQRRAVDEASRAFDLQAGPLLRAQLLRLAADEHQLVLTVHHLVADGWSLGILLQELVELYGAALQGRAASLPEPALRYTDFAHWQRRHVDDDVLAPGLDYWRQQLLAVPILELPTDRPRPAVAKQRGRTLPVRLDVNLSRALEALAEARDSTLYMVLLAAFGTLLSRISNQQDMTVGSPVANRRHVELEGLIGLFVNTLVQRLDFTGEPTFEELLDRVRQVVLASDAHQDVPFEKVVAAVEGERQLSTSPLFQTMLVLQNAPFSSMSLEGLELQTLPLDNGTSKFDLTLALGRSLVGDAAALTGHLEYDADLFDEVTISRWWGHLETLLQSIVAEPSTPLWQLPMLNEAERRQLVEEWSRPAAALSSDLLKALPTVNDLFAAQVQRTPDAPALRHQGDLWTYRQLAARVWHLARRLQGLGVGPDRVVGVCLDRRPQMIVAMLAAQAAGGAYVPLDPNYPAQRLAYILEDTAAPVILTREGLRDILPHHDGTVLCLDEEPPAAILEEAHPTPPAHGAGWENLAHLIYTSGSTGRPKGVAIAHRSSVILMHWAKQAFSADELAGMLAATSINFDLSVFEIFVPLCWGGSVILAENALELPSLPDRERVRLVNTVPSAMAELVRQQAIPSTVQTVNLAGEPLRRALVDGIYDCAQVEGVYNLYGPSEDTTYSTYTRVPAGTSAEPTIGRPLTETQAYVLDRQGLPVVEGAVGELYLGGDGLARGYLGRAAMTAERFVPDHLGTAPGGRLYRTGDLVRYLSSSELLFLGRVDHQVKIRGFRIELGEIESALLAQPEVRDAVVLARQDREGDPRLVAYVTGDGVSTDALRRALGETLPEYMLPAAFVTLPELPLLPNGKVNRKELPAPEWGGDTDAYVAPRDASEETLAAIWQEVLGVERVGVHDNFFALGGHSLLATQVMTRIRSRLQVDLELRHLFEAPTVAELARLATSTRYGSEVDMEPTATGDRRVAPLSFAQERLWFLDQLNPGTATYNIPALVRLHGAIDVELFERALNEVVARHDVLRTLFQRRDGEVVQVVQEVQHVSVPVEPLTHLPEAARVAEAQRLADHEAVQPFDLQRGPLLRARLLKLAEAEYWLLVNMHHIVSDGWSMGVLVRELSALYGAFMDERESPLEPLEVQYSEFAHWQRRVLSGEFLERQLGFWKDQLAGVQPLELPTDYPRAIRPQRRGATLPVSLDGELTQRLQSLANAHGVTLFMLLLGVYGALLSRLTGQTDIAIGTPVANRRRTRIEGMIGFFVNTLVARLDLTGRPSLETLLERCRAVVLAADAHQDVPFEKVVQAVDGGRRGEGSPLFQTLLVLQNMSYEALRLGDVDLEMVPLDNGTAKFDLSLILGLNGSQSQSEVSDGGLQGVFEYDADLFDQATIERWRDAWQTLLRGIVAAPGRAIDSLPLLDGEQQASLSGLLGVRSADYPADEGLGELFRRQAERRPDAEALIFEASDGTVQRMTYGELNNRSDQLAAHLAELGIEPEELVGLCAERSLEMVIGTLGILKAGGAYLPLDPSYPEERLQWMMQDGAVRYLLIQDGLRAHVPAGRDVEYISLDDAGAAWRRMPEENVAEWLGRRLRTSQCGRQLAYLMYTSGSTGRPKGVAIEQRSVSRLVCGSTWADFEPARVFLAFAPISFDAATLEIWGPLLNGGRLVVAPPHQLSVHELAAVIERYGVDSLWLTAGLFHQMVEDGPLHRLGSLRQWFAGGDVLSPMAVKKALQALPECTLFNGYGPTENTTFSTTHAMTDSGQVGETVSIGQPITNSGVQILDDSFHALPVGIFGQLCASGEGLARCYHGHPALTAERFVPNPLAEQPGERIYLTGDRARYLTDGRLEFQGRIDRQVKIRGFRIEPGEVELALAAQPEVRRAAVVVLDEPPRGKRLVAFAVPHDEAPVKDLDETLRQRLAKSLPDYMVPSALCILDELPLDSNGKVNRRALAQLSVPAGDDTATYVAPRSTAEERLAELWCEVLGLERVSVESDFFELGGHSLLATQLVSRIRHALGVDLPLRHLFQASTIAGLAAEVERLQAEGNVSLQAIAGGLGDRDLQLSFAQERLWLLDRFEPGNPAYNMPFALRLNGPLEVSVLHAAMQRLVERHECLRTVYADVGGQPVQHVQGEMTAPLPLSDLSDRDAAAQEEALATLTAQEAQGAFDLAKGPVFRVRLVRLGETRHVLLFNVHHVASDGWSMGLLTRDLGVFYAAQIEGVDADLPALPVRYADYAQWQRDWLQGEVLEQQLGYWRRQLDALPVGLELPTDRPRPAVRSFTGDQRSLRIESALAGDLKRLARQQGGTLFMVLLAAFEVLLSRLSGQVDLAVGTPIAGRQRQEVENLVGIFLNTLVLRGDLTGQPSFASLVDQVRETTLGAYAHQELPFEKLLDELQPERDMARTPFFQVFFNMVNMPLEPLRLPGLVIEPMGQPEAASKFDLTVYAREDADVLLFEWVFNTRLFDGARIDEMLRQYASILRQVAARPELTVDRVDLRTTPALELLPDPTAPLDGTWRGSVPTLMAQQARRHPDKVAVRDAHGAWTYRQLDTQSNRLAHWLRSVGVEGEDRVGILAHRSASLVWAVQGVLKSGGAFVLFDPAYPSVHLCKTLQRAEPKAWLQLSAAGSLPPDVEELLQGMDCPRLTVAPWQDIDDDGGPGPLAAQPDTAPDVEVSPEDLAYISFTSGSTGVPKGILGLHGPLTHFLPWQQQQFDLTEDDVYSMLSGLAHDPLQRDMFTPLCLGATLTIPETRRMFTAGYLADWMRREKVSIAHMTPAMGQVLTEPPATGDAQPLPDLRFAYLTGDVLTQRDVRRLRKLAPHVRCTNFYGSTETQRAVGFQEAPAELGRDGKQIMPLGRGMQDVQLLVVNRVGDLAGIGELGEVWVRSPHLARGYLGDPELSAERFFANPFRTSHEATDGPADRVYRTGDLGRYQVDGTVVFAGRVDHQVKIRGFRIELGEIEGQLAKLPGVREAVVQVRGSERGSGRRLLALVVRDPRSEFEVQAATLRDSLRQRLPEYMVPAGFVFLPSLPLTPNGKLDRRALAQIEDSDREIQMAFKAPRTEMEVALADILKDVLEVDKVGTDDNFFDLGGNSLLLVKFHNRIQQIIEREIQAVEIFNHPTVASLATYLTSHENGAAQPEAVVEDRSEQLKTGRNRLKARLAKRRRP